MMTIPQRFPTETSQIPLTQYAVIDIEGEDAVKYTNGQVTCDVTKIAIGSSSMGAHCDPKGKVIAPFWLVRIAETHFLMVYHTDLKTLQLAEFKKYAVFSKINVQDVSDKYTLTGILAAKEHDINETNLEDAYLISISAHRAIMISQVAVSLYPQLDANWWNYADVVEKMPTLSASHQQEFIPQALNLENLNAISFTKGCYTGQETVARAKYRGANNRALFTLSGSLKDELSSSLTLEKKIGEQWRQSGTIIQSCIFEKDLYMTAVLPIDTDLKTEFKVAEMPHTELKIAINI